MDRVSRDRDVDQLLDEMQAALAELREGLQDGDQQLAGPSPTDEPWPTRDAAIATALTVLEANASVLDLLGEAIGRDTHRWRSSAGSGSEPREGPDEADDAVVGPGNDAARSLLGELRRLNAEIADRLEGTGATNAERGVAIAVESELESIREDLEESREE